MSWRDNLLPASFRGVPFYVLAHEASGGRRTVTHEFPLRDMPQGEDLGRRARSFNLQGYVIGDDYFADRDALLNACEVKAGPGKLVHPWLGELLVRCEDISVGENIKEGGYCALSLKFIEAETEDSESPLSDGLRKASVLDSIRQALRVARAAYAVAVLIRNNPDFLRAAALSALAGFGETLAGRFLGLPGLDLSYMAAPFEAVRSPDADDDAATSLAITNAAMSVALAPMLVAAQPARGQAEGSRGAVVAPGGLPARARALAALAPISVAPQADAAAIVALAQIQALASDAVVLAAAFAAISAEYTSADEIEAMRAGIQAALLARRDAAGARGADDCYLALGEVLAAVVTDLAARAIALPRLARYGVGAALPSLALAQRLYAGPALADDLVALNDARHPAFMPLAGVALRA